ncbi:MAG: hypothetical protein Fur0025_24770 [Oscillatoriaceae cyanobacterium]
MTKDKGQRTNDKGGDCEKTFKVNITPNHSANCILVERLCYPKLNTPDYWANGANGANEPNGAKGAAVAVLASAYYP